MANVNTWSTTASSNATADPDINWSEGQAPASVNDSSRQVMRAIKNDVLDTRGALTTAGSTTAYTLTTNSGASTLANGLEVAAKANATSTGSATLNVDSTGAKKIYVQSSGAFVQAGSGTLVSGLHYTFQYNTALDAAAGGWVITNYVPSNANDVTAASTFGTDNRLLRSDGTGRGSQSSGITVDDSNNVSGMGTLSCGAITSSGVISGTVPSFSAHRNGNSQASIASATETKIVFTNEAFDTGGYYDAATNFRWTPPAGVVCISSTVQFTSSNMVDGAQVYVVVYKNGSAYRYGTTMAVGAAVAVAPSVTLIDSANGTDYYEIYAYAAGAGTKTVNGNANATWFTGAVL